MTSTSIENDNRLYTLYFIRHGEALHNQLEKQAQSAALSLAISQGYDANSTYARQMQEEARKEVLRNNSIKDPPLSELGLEEAKKAKRSLEGLIEAYGLPKVEEVWVSPLQRALMTAATIFPDSDAPNGDGYGDVSALNITTKGAPPIIHVKKEIQERQSGLACDMHSSYEKVRRRSTFKRFSLSCLKLDQLIKAGGGIQGLQTMQSLEEYVGSEDDTLWEDKVVDADATDSNFSELSQSTDQNESASIIKEASAIEDKSMLRERTKKLFDLLAETNSRSICLIGHKGYLRELERGPLGYVDSELFQNCEVRVYRLELYVVGNEKESESAESGYIGSHDDVASDRMSHHESGSERKSSSISIGSPVLQRAEKIASSTDTDPTLPLFDDRT